MEAVELYLGARRGADHMTATERKRIHLRIHTAARKLQVGFDAGWAAKLVSAVQELDVSGRSDLHRALLAEGRRLGLKLDLFSLLQALQLPSPTASGHYARPAEQEAALLTIVSFSWAPVRRGPRDPHLGLLVPPLAEIWRTMTGYSPRREPEVAEPLISKKHVERKRFLFGEWAVSTLNAVDLPDLARPITTVGAVRDAVRDRAEIAKSGR